MRWRCHLESRLALGHLEHHRGWQVDAEDAIVEPQEEQVVVLLEVVDSTAELASGLSVI